MADPIVVQITNGVIAFKRVDTAAVGYLPAWNAPAGKAASAVTMADYETGSATWSCQITSGTLTAAGDTGTTTEVAATFCTASRSIPTPGVTAYTLDVELLQDPTQAPASKGISQYLFEEDTFEDYFMLGLERSDVGSPRLWSGADARRFVRWRRPYRPHRHPVVAGHSEAVDRVGHRPRLRGRVRRPRVRTRERVTGCPPPMRCRSSPATLPASPTTGRATGARLIEDEAKAQLYRDTGDGRFSRSRMGRGQVNVSAGKGQRGGGGAGRGVDLVGGRHPGA